MDNLINGKLNGRTILLQTKLRTYEKIENFFNSINDSKICLILANDIQILPTTKITSYNDLNLECFSKIYQGRNNIFTFNYYRNPYVYYRCKDCVRTAFFKNGEFREKHTNLCRLKCSRTLSKEKSEVESYFNSSESSNDVSIDKFARDTGSLNWSNNQILQLASQPEDVKVHDIKANEVFRKSIHSLSPPSQIDSEFLMPNDIKFLGRGKFRCKDNVKEGSMKSFGKKQLESKIDKIKMKIRTN